MDCKTCADLLVVYKLAVKLYLNAEQSILERNMKRDLGEDYTAALEEAEGLRLASQEASDAFVEHWQQDHTVIRPAVAKIAQGEWRQSHRRYFG
jgi:hypothetical protein